MSRAKGFRLLSFLVLLMLLFSLTTAVFADTSAPAVTNGTAPITSGDGPFGTTPETTTAPPTTAPMTTKIPESSSMLNPDLTTTPETTGDTLMEDLEQNGFRFTGLIIALAIAAAVIILVVLLVPKNKNKR